MRHSRTGSKQGGALLFLGDDSDPYNGVRAWWNDGAKGMSYKAPSEHLFEKLGLSKGAKAGSHSIGKGVLIYETSSPAALCAPQERCRPGPGTGSQRLPVVRFDLPRDGIPGAPPRSLRHCRWSGRVAGGASAHASRPICRSL